MSWNYGMRPILCLQLLVYVAMVFGILPCYDFKQRRLIFKTFSTVYNSFLGLMYASFVYFIYNNQSMSRREDFVLHTADMAISIIGALRCSLLALSTIFKKNQWRELFYRLSSLESSNKLNTRGKTIHSIFRNPYLTTFCLNVTVYLVILFVQVFSFSNNLTRTLFLAFTAWLCFTDLIYFHVFINLILCVKTKYKDINETLTKCEYNSYDLIKKIERVEKFYKIMERIVDLTNNVFGWSIFIHISLQTIVNISCIVRPLAPNIYNENVVGINMASVVWGVNALFQIIVIVFCVDMATREPQKLVKFCMFLQYDMSVETREYERIEIFKKRVREMLPKFTAANFFQITRSTLLSVISVVTTYFIVIVQFYLTSKSR